MPRFAANLGHLFTERPLIERFGAAAAAGFPAVELQFPYDVPTSAVVAELKKHNLTQLAINTPQGPESGLAAIPGRERDFEAAFKRALDYVTAIGGTASSLHDRRGRRECAAGGGQGLHRQYFARRRACGAEQHHAPDRADQPARPPRLFPEPSRTRRRSDHQDRRAECAHPVRFLSSADHRRRPAQALREISAADRPCADRGRAVAPRARHRRSELSGTCSRRSTASATKAGSAANTSRRPAPKTGLAGPSLMAWCRRPTEKQKRGAGHASRRQDGTGDRRRLGHRQMHRRDLCARGRARRRCRCQCGRREGRRARHRQHGHRAALRRHQARPNSSARSRRRSPPSARSTSWSTMPAPPTSTSRCSRSTRRSSTASLR